MTLRFDKRIFNAKAVKTAVRDYGEFADFNIDVRDDGIIVEIDNIAYDPLDVFIGEFRNYVIHKMSAGS